MNIDTTRSEGMRGFFDFIFYKGSPNNFTQADRDIIEAARAADDDYVALAMELGYWLREVGLGPDGEMRYSMQKTIARGEG